MKLDVITQIFVVKEKKFFPLYIKQSKLITEAAQLLLKLVHEDTPAERKKICDDIKKLETEGDAVTQTIFDEIYKTFVTPFDRDDMNKLTSEMDTFMDLLYDSAKRISMYSPKAIAPVWIKTAELILEDAQYISLIVNEFEHFRKKHLFITEQCGKIKEIEHRVDDIYDEYMSYIFGNEKDAIELVKYKNIIQSLEDATDMAKKLAESVRTIIIKQS